MVIRNLVLDLETDSFDTQIAKIRVFGLYDIDNDKYIITSNKDKALDIINNAEFIIGYNIKLYDIPILERSYGIKIPLNKVIDLYYISVKRQSVIIDKPFSNFKLKTIVNELHLDDEGGKGEIDYNIFKKDSKDWTEKEKQDIFNYTKQDLLITAKYWQFLKDKFEPFKEFLSDKDISNYKYINSSMGSYSYKVICNLTGLEERYDFDNPHQKYLGAYVQTPKKEYVRGKILAFDFSSLYPMMFIQANLFSHSCDCCKPEERWSGGFFKLQGRYCKKQQGKIESILKKFYLMRKEFKKNNDQREYVMKIVINSIYGISGSPIFYNLYNLNTASDCTALGQQCIKYGISEFEKAGFVSLYTDTDSIYVEIPEGKTEEQAIQLSRDISKYLSSQFPFPWDEFNLKLDSKIKFISFFRDEGGEFKKKNYLYVKEDNKLVIKGLSIIKKDCSLMSRTIFNKYIKGNIISELRCKYDKKDVVSWIYKELINNREIAAKQFSVKEKENYKNETSIQSMILARYGSGEHKLIKNKRVGIGKGVKYCSLKEAEGLSIIDIDIDIFQRELSPFIKADVQNTLI